MKKKLLVGLAVLLALLIGTVVCRAAGQPPREVYLEGEELADGTVRYQDEGITVTADWNYQGDGSSADVPQP